MTKAEILIVEDDAVVARDIQNRLKALGFLAPAMVPSGEEAIERVKEHKPDLVLMDIMLRGKMDGIEAADQIRSQFNIPVVYVTAYADEDVLERAKVTEPFGYIIKPFEDRDLNTTIEIALFKHKMEKQLKESEEWLSTTLKSIGDAVIATEKNSQVTFMNPVAESLTGWHQEEARGRPLENVFNIINEETRKKVEDPVAEVIRKGTIVGLANHTVLIARDGTEIDIDDSGAPIKNENGDILGVVLVFRDVREVRQAKKKARASEEKYHHLFSSISDAIMLFDPETRKISDVNDAALDLYGYSREEFLTLTQTDITAEPEESDRTIKQTLSGELDRILLRYHKRKDGTIFPVEISSSTMKLGEETVLCGVIRDITERKQAEEALTKSETFLNATGQIAKVGGWEIDGTTKKVFWTKEIYNITEVPDDYDPSSIEKGAIVFFSQEDQLILEKAIQRAFEHGEPYNMEFLITTAKGNKKWTQAVCEPVVVDSKVVKLSGIFQDITERKHAEDELRLHGEITANMAEGVYLVRVDDGVIVYTNPAFVRMFGYEPGELIGKHVSIVNAPSDKSPEETAKQIFEILDKTGSWKGEINNIKKDGTPFWCYANVSMFDHPAYGKVLVTVHTDITKRKQTEEALLESEGKYRSLVDDVIDGSEVGLFILDSDFKVIWVNQALERYFSVKKGEIIGKDKRQLIIEQIKYKFENPEGFAEKVLATYDNNTYIENFECHILSDDKSQDRWLEHWSQPIQSGLYSGGRAELYYDINDFKQAEKALSESEKRYRALFEDNPIETIVVDRDARITMYNKAKRTSSDRLPSIGDVMYKDYAASHLIDMHKELMECIQMGKSKNFTEQDYNDRFLDIRMFPLEEGAIITAIDQTDKKSLEAKLQRTQKMESLGLMAGGIAHDLNNILSGIVSYPELILMDLPEDSKLRKPIETIMESGMRAADVVSDLLTVARGVASSKEISSLNTLVDDYLGSAEHQRLETMHSFITFKTDLDSDLLNIRCSSTHIKKSLTNLILNASEAIEGSGKVTISTENRYLDKPLRGYDDVREGEYAVLTVSDDGSGISADDLERIFEPFYTKKVMGRSGTGLGLAVVWNTLQDHDGYINLNTSEKGTAFELYFPVTRDEVPSEGEAVPVKDYMGNGERVLVVDDEERQREIACKILTKLGYTAEAVSSGEEAIEYLKEQSVDLVVLDMIMPKGINGRETYERIIKIHPGQKAIIASGYAETPDVKKAQKLGAGKYIKKPYTMGKIGLAVKEELEK